MGSVEGGAKICAEPLDNDQAGAQHAERVVVGQELDAVQVRIEAGVGIGWADAQHQNRKQHDERGQDWICVQ